MKQTILLVLGVISLISLVIFSFAFTQVEREQISLSEDLEYRTRLLAESLKVSVEPLYVSNSMEALQKVMDKFADRQRLLGLVVYDNKGSLVAASAGLPGAAIQGVALAAEAMDTNKEASIFMDTEGGKVYAMALPLLQENIVVGAMMVAQRADYIDAAINEIWANNFYRFLAQALIISLVIILILRFFIFRPVTVMISSIRTTLAGGNGHKPAKANYYFFNPLAKEISRITNSLLRARVAASEEARLRLEKLETPWTAQRLQEFVKAYLKGRKIFAVSNREPYLHKKTRNGIEYIVPASGLVTAMEPVMQACGGLWLAHGTGDADKLTVDESDKIQVPPEEPKYTLRRLWMNEREMKYYYVGFCNEALWPLCLSAHTRPIFRKEDWYEYCRVNSKFAESLLFEIKNVDRPLVLIQDFHFALLPQMIKKVRPDAQVSIFWHIPWPNAEMFNICPWRKEIIEGMLGADVIGFHTQQYCNNFMDTVSRGLEAVVDLEQFSITRGGHVSYVKPLPISVAFTNCRNIILENENKESLIERLGIKTKYIGLGVDRLDYVKGIPERFKAIEIFFDAHPEYKEKLTFLQIAPLSRQEVTKYRQFDREVTAEFDRINTKFSIGQWRPIEMVKENLSHEEIYPLYRRADFCLITSLSDGMNIVAKEYAATRDDEAGVLILSQFAGASRDMKGSIIVNPYDAEQTAEAIYGAINMPADEQRRRMMRMREVIGGYNVYRWSAELIKATVSSD